MHTTFPLRRSVSSTELLYERAMARFYEAVELEQASKSRKASQDKLAATPAPPREPPANLRKRLGSMSEAERVSFERRSELRRQSADMVSIARKWDSRENVNDSGNLTRSGQQPLETRRDVRESEDQEELEEEHLTESTADDSEDMDLDFDEDDADADLEYPPQKQKQQQQQMQLQQQSSNDLGSDYTESTASSEQDSIEKFKMELLARTRSPSPRDLETYHPRTMAAGTFTPYRAPTPEQAAVVLNRPVPLPSPDFVPKPILKRSSNEHVEQSAVSPLPAGNGKEPMGGAIVPPPIAAAAVANPSTLKMDLAKGIKSFFSRDKRSATEKNTEANEEISNPLEKTNAAAIAADLEAKRRAKEEEELRRKEEERLMQEEAHAAVDHYSDLVREVGSSHRYHTPLYLDRDELKRAAARAAAETDEEDVLSHTEELKKRLASGGSAGDDMFLAPPVVRERRLSISEREQLVHVRDAASNLAIHRSPDKAETDQEQEQHVPQQQEEYQQDEEPEYPTVLVVPPPKSKNKSESETESVMSEMVEARPDARGRTRLVKVKRVIRRRVPSSTRSRDTSLSRPLLPTGAETSALVLSPADRELLEKTAALAILQSEEQAHEKVRSALSYATDLVLFLVACYVYLFKDARLVLPILGLIIYRQVGDALRRCLPNWLRRRLNGNEGS